MLEWVISSAVLTAIVIALRYVLKGRISPRLRYLLWLPVLLRLLIPVSFGESDWSVMNTIERSERYASVTAAMENTELPAGTMKDTALSKDEAEAAHGGTVYKIQGHSVESGRGELHTYFFKAPAGAVIHRTLTALWIVGAAAFALWFSASNIKFYLKLRRTRVPEKTALSPLPVYVTSAADTPCLFGLFRPTVYLTPEAASDETTLRHSVLHEITHYKHGDHVWSLFRCICLCLHWFDPLVWWAAVLSRGDAELACDEATVRALGEDERAEYGRTLIRMTCRKRSAVLLTATTMSGGGIKERITMIAKRPKTALVTLIAVLLIAVLAVGCTFTGAKKEEETGPWTWAQAVRPEQIELDGMPDDTGELSQILSGLEKDDFRRNKTFTGGEWVFLLECEGKPYPLMPLDGVVTMEYEGVFWDIESPALYAYLAVPSVPVRNEADKSVPQIVRKYAVECAANELNGFPRGAVSEGTITGLQQLDTGTAGLTDGTNMYLMEYSYQMADSEGYGATCLLVFWKDNGGETEWELICSVDPHTVEEVYGTPEMLEKYGNMYIAAATELRAKNLRTEAGDRPVFGRADEAVMMTVVSESGDQFTVPARYFDEMFIWVSSFTFGVEADEEAMREPGANAFSVVLTYADGTEERSGIDIAERDGVMYLVDRPGLPGCWHELQK